MRVPVTRKHIKFIPDASRVVARYFMNGEQRTKDLLALIFGMSESQVNESLQQTLREFASRHRNITRLVHKHCDNVRSIIEQMDVAFDAISNERKMLIGSYLTMEYSIESAAFFNPSIIQDFDQSYLEEGEMRVILSFRATGEGHISSIVFRRGIIDKDNNLHLMSVGNSIDKAEIYHKKLTDNERFVKKMQEMRIPLKYSKSIIEKLPDQFEYYPSKNAAGKILEDTHIRHEKRW